MKKYIAAFCISIALFSCGGGNNKQDATPADSTSSSTATAANDVTSNPDYKKGLDLVSQSNCLTCHKVTGEKLIGPSFNDIANKYAGNDTAITRLAHKIIAGGKGVWGDIIMTPHPDVSEANAEQMVKYILLLKS